MGALLSIPVIKHIYNFIKGGFLAEHLKEQLEQKDKELAKLRRRLKKLERL